jgi:peptidylprolyl isomerase
MLMRHAILLTLLLVAAPVRAQSPSVIPAPPDVAAPPKDAVTTSSGLSTKVLQPGTGKDRPGASDVVTIHYTGWQTNGTMFDSSVSRGQAASFPVNRVIPGFSEMLQLMVPGEKRRAWIPEALAYKGARDPKGMLVFDVELLAIPTRAPADVGAPPADAQRTASGLAYKVQRKGTGTVRPRPTSSVTVHYTGWQTNGKMFDSSVVSGKPATFPLNAVIAGWTEGLQLMVEGEVTRFWIPEPLAYKGQREPKGMLVFDVELLDIQ